MELREDVKRSKLASHQAARSEEKGGKKKQAENVGGKRRGKKRSKEKKKTIEILTSWKHTKTDDHFFAVVFASQ